MWRHRCGKYIPGKKSLYDGPSKMAAANFAVVWLITLHEIWAHRNTPGDQSNALSCWLRVRHATEEITSSLEGLLAADGCPRKDITQLCSDIPLSPLLPIFQKLYNFWWQHHIYRTQQIMICVVCFSYVNSYLLITIQSHEYDHCSYLTYEITGLSHCFKVSDV